MQNSQLYMEFKRLRSHCFILFFDFSFPVEIFPILEIIKAQNSDILFTAGGRNGLGEMINVLIQYKKIKNITSLSNYQALGVTPAIQITKSPAMSLINLKSLLEYEFLGDDNEIEMSVSASVSKESAPQMLRTPTKVFSVVSNTTASSKNSGQLLKNKRYLEADLKELVNTGELCVLTLGAVLNARKHYKSIEKRVEPREIFDGNLKSNWCSIAFKVDLKSKKRHLWLYSRGPNCGKTTFLRYLRSTFRCYTYNYSEKYQNPDQDVEILIFDEFQQGVIGKPKLCEICDGCFAFPQKLRDPVRPLLKLVVICSNNSISDVYLNEDIFISARFTEVEVKNDFNLALKEFSEMTNA